MFNRYDFVRCPDCKGKRFFPTNFGSYSSLFSEIRCSTCDGAGHITGEELVRLEGYHLGHTGKVLEDYVNAYFKNVEREKALVERKEALIRRNERRLGHRGKKLED